MSSTTVKSNNKKTIAFFGHGQRQEWAFMSNFYPCEIEDEGIKFTTSEQYYMYQKAKIMGDVQTADAIIEAKSPSDAKVLGKRIMPFSQILWNQRKTQVMKRALHLKFANSPILKSKLIATGDAILVEASPTDRIWGAGLLNDDPNINDPKKWRGLNLLGRCLMEVREELK